MQSLLRGLTRLVVALGVSYLGLMAFAFFAADYAIFRPRKSSYTNDDWVEYQDVAQGQQIALAWLGNEDAKYTILLNHGNAEDLGQVYPFMEMLHRQGFSVLSYDYRGYGVSSGTPSVARCYADSEVAWRYLREVKQVPPGRIILLGRSVGSAPAVHLAEKFDPGGLIVQCGFVSAYRVVTRIPLLPFDEMPNLKRIPEVDCPVWVVHGRRDGTVPFWHGPALFAGAREPKQKLWVEDAGHNDLVAVAGEAYWSALSDFRDMIESEQTDQ